MNLHDPKFTARLEPALRMLARNPQMTLAYLTRRCDLEVGDLAQWLAEFNRGERELASATIDKVKERVGGMTVTSARPAPAIAPSVSMRRSAARARTSGNGWMRRRSTSPAGSSASRWKRRQRSPPRG